jgi:hypothetical protein
MLNAGRVSSQRRITRPRGDVSNNRDLKLDDARRCLSMPVEAGMRKEEDAESQATISRLHPLPFGESASLGGA